MTPMTYQEVRELEQTMRCGQCGSRFLLPWAGNGYLIKCARDPTHKTITRVRYTRTLADGKEYNIMTQQIVKSGDGLEIMPQQGEPGLSVQMLQHTATQLGLVEQFVREQLREGEDFGKVPGVARPFLWKPGAENLASLFKCRAVFEQMERQVEATTGFVLFQHRCQWVHMSSGVIVLEGMGSCNSYEVKYRYREMKRSCPECKKATIRRGSEQYGGGWFCAARDGGCGASYKGEDAAQIDSQQVGREQNPDLLDGINTYMKMSMKRSETDCAMRAPGVARFFAIDHSEEDRSASEDQEARTPAAPRAPRQRPAATRAAPASRAAQAPAQAPPQVGCSGHNNARLYRNEDNTWSHRLPDRSQCFGIPAQAQAAPPADKAPADLPPGHLQDVENLRDALASANIKDEAAWCRDFLKVPSLEAWFASGKTVAQALIFVPGYRPTPPRGGR